MIIPFLNFQGKCGEAIAFYEEIFEVSDKRVMLYSDLPENPNNPMPADMGHYVLHAELTIAGARVWMGDTSDGVEFGDAVSLAVPFPTVEDVEDVFNKLLDGGGILIPLGKTFYSPMFGAVRDRFGVIWHLVCMQ